MEDKLDLNSRRKLHGKNYVESFERAQSSKRLSRIIDRIPKGIDLHVVDLGCGSGMALEFLCDNVSKYVGFDFSEEFIVAANERKKRLHADHASFECGSIIDLCHKYPNAFDVALAMDISEHVYDDEWQEIVTAAYGSLKPGGCLYIHTPNAEFFVEMMKAKGILLRQFPEHIAVRNAEDNRNFVARAGFNNVSVEFLPHYNILRIVHVLSLIPLIGMFFQARILITAIK